MNAINTEMSGAHLYALPIVSVLVIAAIVRGVVAAKRVRDWQAAMERQPGNASPGAGYFEVETLGDQPTNLGHSSETEGASGSPTLVTEPVVLRVVGGPRVRLSARAALVVGQLVGAKRRTIDTTTTENGVSSTITFELAPHTRFWLECALAPVPAGGSTAYRDDEILETSPLGDHYAVEGGRPVPLRILPRLLWLVPGTGFFGALIGFLASISWRTGENELSSFVVPAAVYVDAACFASVGVMLVLHLVGFPSASDIRKMRS